MSVLERRRLPKRASKNGNEKEVPLCKKRIEKGEVMADAKVCPYQPDCSKYFSLEWSLENKIPAWSQIESAYKVDHQEIKAAMRKNILCECCISGMCHALHSGHFLQNVLTIIG